MRSQHPKAPHAYRTAVGTRPFRGAKSTLILLGDACSNGSIVQPESNPTHPVLSGVRVVFSTNALGPSPPAHVGQ